MKPEERLLIFLICFHDNKLDGDWRHVVDGVRQVANCYFFHCILVLKNPEVNFYKFLSYIKDYWILIKPDRSRSLKGVNFHTNQQYKAALQDLKTKTCLINVTK